MKDSFQNMTETPMIFSRVKIKERASKAATFTPMPIG